LVQDAAACELVSLLRVVKLPALLFGSRCPDVVDAGQRSFGEIGIGIRHQCHVHEVGIGRCCTWAGDVSARAGQHRATAVLDPGHGSRIGSALARGVLKDADIGFQIIGEAFAGPISGAELGAGLRADALEAEVGQARTIVAAGEVVAF